MPLKSVPVFCAYIATMYIYCIVKHFYKIPVIEISFYEVASSLAKHVWIKLAKFSYITTIRSDSHPTLLTYVDRYAKASLWFCRKICLCESVGRHFFVVWYPYFSSIFPCHHAITGSNTHAKKILQTENKTILKCFA